MVTQSTSVGIRTIETTINGKPTHVTQSTTSVSSSTTGYATSTLSPTLNGSSDNSGSELSSASKRIIGGVVGGIGGVIVLGAIAIVLWRLYGKKRRHADGDDYDDLASSAADDYKEKKGRRASALPFRNNLEQYHSPSAQINTASNF